MKSSFFLVLLFFLVDCISFAQSALAPLNEDYYHLLDRYEIKSGQINPYFHTSFKAYQRKDIGAFIDSLRSQGEGNSSQDLFNFNYLSNDNWEWSRQNDSQSKKSFLGVFYKRPSDFYHVHQKHIDLHINPVLVLNAGMESSDGQRLYTNSRGIQIRGQIDDKVGFYSYIVENQVINPQFVRNRIANNLAVPYEGFWKPYSNQGVDFFTARGYITFNATKHINLQFGHDRFFIGNGQRSLILSDQSPAYLFLKLQTKVWKFNYTNVFANLTADVFGNASGLTANARYPEKFMALHHLGVNIGKKLSIGIFESVIFDRSDILGNNNFDLRYLNPIIFYRAIEQQNGSADNVLLGMDFKYLPFKGVSIYGQLTLDEFLIDNLKAGNGWWGNKFAIQIGGEYIDAFGINNLDIQVEANLVRPYTFSHSSTYGSHSNYRQPLAHQLGANFYEGIGVIRFQPIDKLYLTAKLVAAEYGTDGAGENWGGDILQNNSTREMDFGNEIGQGQSNELMFMDFTVSYMWKHNFFIEGKLINRTVNADNATDNTSTNYASLGIRCNIPQRLHEF